MDLGIRQTFGWKWRLEVTVDHQVAEGGNGDVVVEARGSRKGWEGKARGV